jgi:hypothetical protein
VRADKDIHVHHIFSLFLAGEGAWVKGGGWGEERERGKGGRLEERRSDGELLFGLRKKNA